MNSIHEIVFKKKRPLSVEFDSLVDHVETEFPGLEFRFNRISQ